MPNTFLEKTIEDWLTKTNELGYQLPFCQLLTNRGMRVVHVSKHNPFEQGKDVIAVDADGQPHAYQLKGGNITLSVWRNLVRAEVDELLEVRIKHPAVDPARPHKSYLVTNGYLEDTVRILIDDMNATRWRVSPLHVITRGQLLADFIELSGAFIPQELTDYRLFLELYFSDGRGTLDNAKFSSFVEEVVGLRRDPQAKREQRKRAIAVAVLYTAYILQPFRAAENHVTVVQVLVTLAATILACAERYRLPAAYWESSFDLVSIEIDAASRRLVAELGDSPPSFKESPYDGALAPFRRQLALSCYLAHFVSRLIAGDPDSDQYSPTVIAPANFHFWGEGAVPDFLLRCLLVVGTQGQSDDAYGSVLAAIDTLIRANGRSAMDAGVFSPFYTAEEVAIQVLGMADEPVYEAFTGSSYCMASLLLILARHNRRNDIEQRWSEITHISHVESLPDERWEDLTFRAEHGVLRSVEFRHRESWAAIKAWATPDRPADVANVLREKSAFLPYFLAVYPHRLRPTLARFLTELVEAAAEERRPTVV